MHHNDRKSIDWQQHNDEMTSWTPREDKSLIAAGGPDPILIEKVIVKENRDKFLCRTQTMGLRSMRRMALLRYSSFTSVGSSCVSELRRHRPRNDCIHQSTVKTTAAWSK